MKRVSFLIISIVIAIVAIAKDITKDISMVSYEQSWLDDQGTLSLKNNTNEEIRNIVFMIRYCDMSGKELDYNEFADIITIAPGMTRKLNIPAYEHSRNYHYYKTKDEYGHPAFKIEFVLKNYNVPIEEIEGSNNLEDILNPYHHNQHNESEKNIGLSILLGLIGVVIIIGISVGLYVIVALMAQKRGRSVVLWVLLSILATPLLMIIILLIIGKDESRIENRDWEE